MQEGVASSISPTRIAGLKMSIVKRALLHVYLRMIGPSEIPKITIAKGLRLVKRVNYCFVRFDSFHFVNFPQ